MSWQEFDGKTDSATVRRAKDVITGKLKLDNEKLVKVIYELLGERSNMIASAYVVGDSVNDVLALITPASSTERKAKKRLSLAWQDLKEVIEQ